MTILCFVAGLCWQVPDVPVRVVEVVEVPAPCEEPRRQLIACEPNHDYDQ